MVSKTGRGKLVLGTEHYMAPEVAAGEEATPQADAYALGVMLLRWLTGFYYGDNPGAIALLSKKKFRWLGVISQLIAPAARRPERYSDLLERIKPNELAASVKSEKREKAKRRNAMQNLVAVLLGIGVVAGLSAGGYYGWRYLEAQNAKRDQQMAALQQQMREKEAAEAKAKAEEAAQKAKEAEEKRIAAEKAAAERAAAERVAAGRTGQVLNVSSLAGDAGISPKVASDWLSLLESSYIVKLVEPWSANINKRLVKAPKLYFLDVGLASSLLGISSFEQLQAHPLRGALFETMVVDEFLKTRENVVGHYAINYYRDSNRNEIDLVIEDGGRVMLYEVKSGATYSPDWLATMKRLSSQFGSDTCLNVIYGGDTSQERKEFNLWSWRDLP